MNRRLLAIPAAVLLTFLTGTAQGALMVLGWLGLVGVVFWAGVFG